MAEKHAMDIKGDHDKTKTQEGAASVTSKSEHTVDVEENEAHPYREWTEEALYEKAEAVGVEGYADMDKEDLINALRNY